MPPTKLQSSAGSSNGHSLAELEEEVVIARAGDAIAEATSDHRGAILDQDARQAARRAAVDIAAAALTASSADTAAHSDDVDIISEGIGHRFGLSGERLEDVMMAARLHDIGKLGVPQSVIEKQGPLDEAEWALLHRHTIVGEQILLAVPELRSAARLVRHSHERWDGGGYPDGLKGEEIPLGSRIVFCADAYHAIRSDRPYREGRSAAEALAEIRSCAGTQFDPAVVAALEGLARQLRATRNGHRPALGRSRRLMALMMIISVGTCGSALARSGLIPEAKPLQRPAANLSAPSPMGAFNAAAQPVLSAAASDGRTAATSSGEGAGTLGGAGLLTLLPPQLMVPSLAPGLPGLGEAGPAGESLGEAGAAQHDGSPGVRDHGQGVGRGKGQGKGHGTKLGRGDQKSKAAKTHGEGSASAGNGAGKSKDHPSADGSGKSKSHSGKANESSGNPSTAGGKEKGGSAKGGSGQAKSGTAGGAEGNPTVTKQPKPPKQPKPAKPPKNAESPTTSESPDAPAATGSGSPSGSGGGAGNPNGGGNGTAAVTATGTATASPPRPGYSRRASVDTTAS